MAFLFDKSTLRYDTSSDKNNILQKLPQKKNNICKNGEKIYLKNNKCNIIAPDVNVAYVAVRLSLFHGHRCGSCHTLVTQLAGRRSD